MPRIFDLSAISIVDAHCHSYLETPTTLTGDEFARHASMAVQPSFLQAHGSETQIRRSRDRLYEIYREQPYFRYMISMLAKFFNCPPNLIAVAENRNARANDFDAYVKQLFEDMHISGLVMDGGYPPLSQNDLKRFPAKVVSIFRLETFISDLLNRHNNFNDFYSDYESGIREAVKSKQHVGLKTIIAYRTGLRIRRVPSDVAKNEFLEAKNGTAEKAWFGPKVKRLRDYLIIRALELSVELDVPMQFHTGVGDYDIVLDQCDPALLYDLLKDEKLRHATVVLVHSGFPNTQNAAFIVSMLPNVFLDFSLTIPYLNPVESERLKEILQIAPSSKVMYGSDGFNLPELYWLGAKVGKNVLSKCLSQLCEDGLFSDETVRQMATKILFENANKLYGLNLA